jgi:hypothetical protein
MKKQSNKETIRTLRDAYKVSGFRVRARIEGYDELQHNAFVITLDRRSKKVCAAGAEKGVATSTVSAGAGRGISAAGIERSTLILRYAASNARPVA